VSFEPFPESYGLQTGTASASWRL